MNMKVQVWARWIIISVLDYWIRRINANYWVKWLVKQKTCGTKQRPKCNPRSPFSPKSQPIPNLPLFLFSPNTYTQYSLFGNASHTSPLLLPHIRSWLPCPPPLSTKSDQVYHTSYFDKAHPSSLGSSHKP